MSVPDTKARILDAAERLFAAEGLAGVSLRAVTAEAGVNLAAVNYHFGSKEALLGAMVRRFLASVNAEQERLLDELLAQESVPSIEQALVALATPVFALYDTHRGRDWGQAWMYARRGENAGREMLPGMSPTKSDAATSTLRRYYEVLRQALPHVPPDELWWRLERANNLLMANQGKQLIPQYESGEMRPSMRQDERTWLIAFLAGALSAPAIALRTST